MESRVSTQVANRRIPVEELQTVQLKPVHKEALAELFSRLSGHLEKNEEHALITSQIRSIYQEVIRDFRPKLSLSFLDLYQPEGLINHYFDQIYVLNLDSRPDRMAHMNEQLHRVGIYKYERFPALYGKEEPHFSEWKKYLKVPLTRQERTRYQRKGIGSPGSWAILKSMYLMIRQAQVRGYQRILVFQDDLLFHKNFNREFESLVRMGAFPKQWKLFYLGGTQHAWSHVKFHKSGRFYHPGGTADGAFGVAIDCSIFEEMINEILEFTLPVDSGTLKSLQRRYQQSVVVAYPNLVIADIRDSDLRGYRNLDRFAKKFRWELKNYHIVNNLVDKGKVVAESDEW